MVAERAPERPARHTSASPCGVCSGHPNRPSGRGERCAGFMSSDGAYCYCTREEYAGGLTPNTNTSPPAYAHRMSGACVCGTTHGAAPVRAMPHGRGEPSAIYDYDTYQVCRYDLPNGGKRFKQRRPDTEQPGRHIYNMNGVERRLYHQDELPAPNTGAQGYVTEGEKCADTLRGLGFNATTNSGGAGKWEPRYAERLAGNHIVILADDDEPGRHHAETVAASVAPSAASVRVITFDGLTKPNGNDGADVCDWLAACGTAAELQAMVQNAPLWQPSNTSGFVSARDLMAAVIAPLRWAVEGIVPEGLIMLAGKPKMGKSWLALALAIAIAFGGYALGSIPVEQGDVLYLALEDGTRRLQDRLRVLLPDGQAPGRLDFLTECPRLSEGGIALIERWLGEHPDARLVVVDTLKRVRDRAPQNRGLYDTDYEGAQPLQELAQRHRVTILVVHHFNKSLRGDDWYDAISGSTGLTAVCDGVLALFRKRGDADAQLGVSSRDGEEAEKALRWDAPTCTWTLMGDASEYEMSRERLAIVDVVAGSSEPATPKLIAEALGVPSGRVRKLLGDMVRDGQVQSPSRGQYRVSTCGNNGNNGNDAPDSPDSSGLPAPALLPLPDEAGNNGFGVSTSPNGNSDHCYRSYRDPTEGNACQQCGGTAYHPLTVGGFKCAGCGELAGYIQ